MSTSRRHRCRLTLKRAAALIPTLMLIHPITAAHSIMVMYKSMPSAELLWKGCSRCGNVRPRWKVFRRPSPLLRGWWGGFCLLRFCAHPPSSCGGCRLNPHPIGGLLKPESVHGWWGSASAVMCSSTRSPHLGRGCRLNPLLCGLLTSASACLGGEVSHGSPPIAQVLGHPKYVHATRWRRI